MAAKSVSSYFMLVKILLLLTLLIPLHVSAQLLPVDAVSGKIYYAEEVLVKDGPQFDLYNRAKIWFVTSGHNKEVLQVDDLANGLIIGCAYRDLSVAEGHKAQKFRLWFTLKIEMEDDRYWYSITDFQLQDMPLPKKTKTKVQENKVPLEELVLVKSEGALKDEKGKFNNLLEHATHKTIIALIKDLKASML